MENIGKKSEKTGFSFNLSLFFFFKVLNQGPAEPCLLPGGHWAACGAGGGGRRGDADNKAVAEN